MKLSSHALLVLATLGASSPLYADILSSKRGFADTGAGYANLQASNAGWYYTWGTGPANPGNFDANFYPMFWNGPSQSTIDNALARNPNYILGFNEPERSDQANMSVATAISAWTTISNSTKSYNTAHGTSIKLVSPAVADTGGTAGGQQWLANFMSQATAASLKVDAVAFHWYGVSTPDNPSGAASSFLSRVDSYHNSYGLPVFITEFAIHDWGGIYTDDQIIEANRQFLNIVIPGLESRSYVAGYAWYNWFSDSPLYTNTGGQLNPTQMGWSYVGAIGSTVVNLSGLAAGEHVADLSGGTLTATSTAPTLKFINALGNTSSITGTIDWGMTSSTNWVRIQPGATLRKMGTNQITLTAPVSNDGTLEVAQGVLRLGGPLAGAGSLLISSTGDATGSTARLELTGNINIPNPVTFAQRNDSGASDGIRNVSGNNALTGPMTITVGGSQARVRSDAGTLTLGPITTNATSPRNFYLQGAGDGVLGGVISDNATNAAGKINLFKEGAGTWTFNAASTYTGTTTINGGTLRLGQVSAGAAVANYSFDSVSGSTVLNTGTGGSAMNGTLTGGATIVAGGQAGNALSLANGAYVNINNPIANLGNTANWTLSAWVKTTTAGATILSKSNGGWASGNTIFYLGDGTGAGSGGIPSAVRWGGGFYQGSTGAASIIDNAWHQVAYVNAAGSYALYIDGVAQTLASGNSSFSNADVGSIVRLGYTTDNVASDGTVNFTGLLDSVQIYTQALSASQVAALFLGGTTGQLPSATPLTIAAGATLDLNNNIQQIATLNGPAGAAVSVGAGQLIVSSAANSQFAGSISGNGGSIVKSGAGILTLSGPLSYSGPTLVNAGTLQLFASNDLHAISGQGTLEIGPSASVGSDALDLNALVLNANSIHALHPNAGSIASRVNTLTLSGAASAWTSRLEIADNPLIVQPAAADKSALLPTLQNQIASGASGSTGITSSVTAADPTRKVTVIVDNALLNLTTFFGQPVDNNSLLIASTWLGDSNLDRKVDVTDLGTLATHYGRSTSNGILDGDFNQDGQIDVTDLGLLATNYGIGTNGTPFSAISIPEPASLVCLLPALSLLIRRNGPRR